MVSDEGIMYTHTECLKMEALESLGNHHPLSQLSIDTEISTEQHCIFFHLFVDKVSSMKNECIKYPSTMEEFLLTMNKFDDLLLSGAAGSIDVIHLKYRNCPTEDYNQSSRKEQYPTLVFEVVFYMVILRITSLAGSSSDI